MAKRRGVNSRNKYRQRKKKAVSRFRRMLPVIGIVIAAGAAVLAAWYGGKMGYGKLKAALDGSSLFTINKITVRGNERVAAASIIEQCRLGDIRKMYRLEADSVVAMLSADPWIDRARCLKRWWGEVVIEVRERTPFALVHTGTVRLTDEQGVLLPVTPGVTYDLPLLTSVPVAEDDNGRLRCDSAVFSRARRLITTVKREDCGLMKEITQIDMRSVDAARCRFASYGAEVIIDCVPEVRQLRNLRQLLVVLEREGDTDTGIDMRYRNIAFVRNDGENDGSKIN